MRTINVNLLDDHIFDSINSESYFKKDPAKLLFYKKCCLYDNEILYEDDLISIKCVVCFSYIKHFDVKLIFYNKSDENIENFDLIYFPEGIIFLRFAINFFR